MTTSNTDDILVVDDNETNRHILSRILTHYGYQVRQAGNGRQALELAIAHTPDLILLDIMMPGMDGYEVCRRLKAHDTTRNIPVIFVSAIKELADKMEAFEVGGVDYIPKPYQSAEVLARVRAHLTIRHLQKSLSSKNQTLQTMNQQLQHDIVARRQTEDKLRQLSRAVEQSANAVVITDLAGNVEFVNPAFCETSGYTRAEVIGKKAEVFSSGYQTPGAHEDLWATLRRGEVWQGAFLNRTKTGRLFWEFTTISPVKDAEGNTTHYLAIKEDITERKLAEAALQKAKEELEARVSELSMLNMVTQMVASVSKLPAALRIVAQNMTNIFKAQCCQIALIDETYRNLSVVTEYPKQEGTPIMVGRQIPIRADHGFGMVINSGQSLVIAPAHTDPLAAPIHDVIAARRIHALMLVPLLARGNQIGTIIISLDQHDRVFTTNDVRLAETVAAQIAGVIDNVRLYEDNARLYREEQKQRRVAESLSEVAMVLTGSLDRDTVLNAIIDQLQHVLSFDQAGIFFREGNDLVLSGGSNFPTQDIGHRISLDDAEPAVQVFQQQAPVIVADVRTDPSWTSWYEQVPIRAWMGAPLLVDEESIGILTVDSFAVGTYQPEDAEVLRVFAAHAATAIRNAGLYASAQESRAAAEAANLAKSRFLANMSHELRTPLNAVLGYAQLLQKEPNPTPTLTEGLRIIQRSGEHLLTLINDILDLSKIEADRLELYLTDFYLPTFIKNLVDMFQIRADSKNITFVYEQVTPLTGMLRADEKHLRQILINLLSNAIKFTQQGEVIFRVGRSPNVTPDPGTILLRFEVIDTGPGIPADKLREIFEPFRQVEDIAYSNEGTGLGLAISQRLAELMASQLHVESQVGQGSRFWLDISLISLDEPEQNATPNERVIVGVQGQAPTVLIVDDGAENRAFLKDALTPLGFTVLEAADGTEGLDKASDAQPAVILVDRRMPNMDGFEMIRELRRRFAGEPMRPVVIAISASVFEKDRRAGIEAGCDAFLPKPIDLFQLLKLLEQFLNLAWVYDDVSLPKPSELTFMPPPPKHMAILRRLADVGDVPGILDWASTLPAPYQPFADKIRTLADSYQVDQIHQLIDSYSP